jgi:hypothetical protein
MCGSVVAVVVACIIQSTLEVRRIRIRRQVFQSGVALTKLGLDNTDIMILWLIKLEVTLVQEGS